MKRKADAALRSEAEFAAYAVRYPAPIAADDAEAVAQTIARTHCAGRRGSVDGSGILAALAAAPDPTDAASQTVKWMLTSIRAHECALLVTRCGVRPMELARHVRARPTHRSAIVRFLNQFTLRDRAGRNREQPPSDTTSNT